MHPGMELKALSTTMMDDLVVVSGELVSGDIYSAGEISHIICREINTIIKSVDYFAKAFEHDLL